LTGGEANRVEIEAGKGSEDFDPLIPPEERLLLRPLSHFTPPQ
jgi:hypothetical protein